MVMNEITAKTSGNTSSHEESGLWVGVVMMLTSLIFVLACAMAPAAQDKSIALIFAPGTTFSDAATRLAPLDARIMRMGASENIVIVRFFNGWRISDLWHIGALIPLKARAIGDCLNTSAKSQI